MLGLSGGILDPGEGPRSALFAVNVPREEIDPTAVGDDELAAIFPNREVTVGGPGTAEWANQAFTARRGRDLAPWLLGLALALAAIEVFLATPGRAKKRAERADAWSSTAPETQSTTGAS